MPTPQTMKEQARAKIEALIREYRHLKQKENNYFKRMSETDVINKFVTPLFQALGWPVGTAAYSHEVHVESGGRVDIRAEYAADTFIYIEAKRFGVIDVLEEGKNKLSRVLTPGQMRLPGMPKDRTKEEQQAINYAFANNGTWAILTNFERFRLFNARRDWLLFSIENPDGYLDEDFEYLWQLAWHKIQQGSLDELSRQRVRADVDDDYLAFINEWRLRLAQNIIERPQSNRWAFHADGTVKLNLLRSVVQRILDRLVLVRYAEDHLVARPGTLQQMLETSEYNIYSIPFNEQLQRLYRKFDQFHNSALFAEGEADRADVESDVLGALVMKLYEARFRAMTPDIMGNTYEQYLGKALVVDAAGVHARDNLETRKKQGSYYTPQVIVRYIVDSSLGRFLYGDEIERRDGGATRESPVQQDEEKDREKRKTWEEIRGLRLIDPACGSGAFLVYAYQVLADFYRAEIKRIEGEREAERQQLIAQSDREFMKDPYSGTNMDIELKLHRYEQIINYLYAYPRLIVERHIYGVDLDPQAAEIATVNLIMRAMADLQRDSKTREIRLPLILNQNVKVGNALIGTAGHSAARYEGMTADLATLRRLRVQLITSGHDEGDGHEPIIAEIERVTARLSGVLDVEIAPHFEQLDVAGDVDGWREQVRPFHWAVEFPELFVDEAGEFLGEQGGFAIVVGNPPWEIVKPDLREYYAQFDPMIESKLTRKKVEARIGELDAADPTRLAEWTAQKVRIGATAAYFKKCDDYTRQGRGDTATHKLFVERGYTLLRDGGQLGYVIPSGIYTDLGTKELRKLLIEHGKIESLFGFTNGIHGGNAYFKDIHRSFKISLIIFRKGITSDSIRLLFTIDPRAVPQPENLSKVSALDKFTSINLNTIRKYSPENLAFFEFASQDDYKIIEKLLFSAPQIGVKVEGSWNPTFVSGLHKTNQRHLFNEYGKGFPIYEGKNLHYYGEILREPEFWMEEEIANRVQPDSKEYRFGFRRIARGTDIRTLIVSCLPQNSCAMYTLTTLRKGDLDPDQEMFLYACMASFVLDFLMRFQIASSVAIFNIQTLPIYRLQKGDAVFDEIVSRAAQLTCTTSEFAELWESVTGTAWVAQERLLDDDERQQVRNQLDGLIAHLYGLSRDEFAHILSTFPLVFRDTDAGAAKKAALLAVYDENAPAVRSIGAG